MTRLCRVSLKTGQLSPLRHERLVNRQGDHRTV
jgi:hypothetical protein